MGGGAVVGGWVALEALAHAHMSHPHFFASLSSRLHRMVTQEYQLQGLRLHASPPVCRRAWVRGKGGVIVGDLPPYEAFPIGGTNSVRGYSEGAALVGGCPACLALAVFLAWQELLRV